MKLFSIGLLFSFLIGTYSCSPDQTKTLPLAGIYNKYAVEGSFLLQSLTDQKIYVFNENYAQKGFIPASTFKIVSTIIALETGVALDENQPILWDSIPRAIRSWNQDHTLSSAFSASCVPCFQHLVGQIGLLPMQDWVRKLDYGKMDIQQANLTNFWLRGQSEITPYQQLDFLKRLVQNELPLKPSTYTKINKIMTMVDDSTGIVIKGKTGMAILDGQNIGWFVGLLERSDGERFVFVNNITCKAGAISENKFMMARKKIVGEALKELGVF